MNYMISRLVWLIVLLHSFIATTAVAESGFYRVEVVIFQNIHESAEAAKTVRLRDYSKFPTLKEELVNIEEQTDPPEGILPQPNEGITDELTVELSAELSSDQIEARRTDLPDELSIVTQKSAYMTETWRRLRSSQNYRPLLYSAWNQNRTDYYPPMRVHNEQLIDTQLRPPTTKLLADLAKQQPLAAYLARFYQLDGTVQLRRSRFLHLYLDLEFRVVVQQPNEKNSYFSEANTSDDTLDSPEYASYSLLQNRQIRTGRMQYFDTPYFGALVFVTAIGTDESEDT